MPSQKQARYFIDDVKTIESLPKEVMFEILVRVPAQDIYYAASLVCPSWYKIISTRDFVRAHLQQSSCGLLIQHKNSKYIPPIFVATQKDQIEISNFDHKRKVLSSCNGLVLDYDVYDYKRDLHISNPVTKRHFALPPLYANNPNYRTNYKYAALAYAAASGKYKVLRTSFVPYNIVGVQCCAILTVGVNKDWRPLVNVEQEQRLSIEAKVFIHFLPPLTTEGFVHWAINNYVLTLNVETEIFAEYRPARHGGETKLLDYRYYLPMGSHLSMLIGDRKFSWELWIMKSETGEWTKMTSIDLEAEKCTFEGLSALNCKLKPVGWSKPGEVLVFRVLKLDCGHNFCSDVTRIFIASHGHDCYCHTRFCIAYNVFTRKIDSFELKCHESNYYIVHQNSVEWLDRVPFINYVGETNLDKDVIRDEKVEECYKVMDYID